MKKLAFQLEGERMDYSVNDTKEDDSILGKK
jgi:hypothetical protein